MTTTTNMGTPIIDATTIRVTPKDRPEGKAKADAVAHTLERLVAEGRVAADHVAKVSQSALTMLVDAYRTAGEPCADAMRTGLVKSVRAYAAAAERPLSTFQRGHRIVSHWQDGESTEDAVGRFYAENPKQDGIVAFVTWIGGSDPKARPTKAQALAAAVRACRNDGMSDDEIRAVVDSTLAQ